MSENQNTPTGSTELDFDDWLAGGERTTHHVTVFARYDLIADIDALEKQRVHVPEVREGDESLGGEENPNADIDDQIDALNARIYASKREFRVSALTDQETQQIREDVRKEHSTQIDAAADYGRAEGKKSAKRAGITAVNDVNGIIAKGGIEEASNLINHEVALRMIAQATKTRHGGDWVPLSVDNVRAIYQKLGQAQIDRLADAASQASSDVPAVTVPK